MANPIHLKGLNGIRAIAALAVVISHTMLAGPALGLPADAGSLDLAGFGVSMFFALSGFLITYLLLLEKDRYGIIKVRAFYLRRVLRIWPLYYFYITLVIGFMLFVARELVPWQLLFYFFLAANIPFVFGGDLALLSHYWSLGVEEQFYLFWPWIIRQVSRVERFLIIFILLYTSLKVGCRILEMKTGLSWPYLLLHVTRFECMAIGALGAFYFHQRVRWFLRIVKSPFVQTLAWGVMLAVAFNVFHVFSVIDNDIIAVVTLVIIVNVAGNPGTLISLEYRILDFLGKISYGIYVYHPLIITIISWLLLDHIDNFPKSVRPFIVYPGVALLTVLVSWVSFRFFETPFLRIKEKFSPIPSSGNTRL